MNFFELKRDRFEEVAKNYVETFNAPPWNDSWTQELVMAKLDEIMISAGAYGLVCYDDAGVFSGAVLGNSEIYFDCRQFYIKEFFVTPVLQRRGIGTKLLLELEKRLNEMDITKMYLITEKNGPARTFYKKQGFGDWEDMILMGKKYNGRLR